MSQGIRTMKKWRWYGIALLSWLMVLWWGARPSYAHWADLSAAEFVVKAGSVGVNLTVPTPLLAFVDRDRDGRITSEEVQDNYEKLQGFLADRVILTDDRGQRGVLKLSKTAQVATLPNVNSPESHTTLQLSYNWPEQRQGLNIRYTLFEPNVATAQSLATVTMDDTVRDYVFSPSQPTLNLSDNYLWSQISRFVPLGIEHILTGYDHLLFLLSLLIGSSGIRSLLKIVTAFTVAHSVTLTLAVLGFIQLPPVVVECAIALSIVYVAAENLWRKEIPQRWVMTFVFGLIHGVGFSSILQEFNLPKEALAVSLVSFNLGVEIGQVVAVVCFFGLWQLLRKLKWSRPIMSGMLVAIGLYWFLQRATGG
jgi:hydrogenase/urease accessory protein HupE